MVYSIRSRRNQKVPPRSLRVEVAAQSWRHPLQCLTDCTIGMTPPRQPVGRSIAYCSLFIDKIKRGVRTRQHAVHTAIRSKTLAAPNSTDTLTRDWRAKQSHFGAEMGPTLSWLGEGPGRQFLPKIHGLHVAYVPLVDLLRSMKNRACRSRATRDGRPSEKRLRRMELGSGMNLDLQFATLVIPRLRIGFVIGQSFCQPEGALFLTPTPIAVKCKTGHGDGTDQPPRFPGR